MALSLSSEEIKEYTRMRYPFLLIDGAYDIVPGKSAKSTKTFSKDAWFFPCHFPGNPVVPGIIQIELIFQTAALMIHTLPGNKEKTSYASRITNTGFFAHIRPDDIMQIETYLESWKRGIGKGHGFITVEDKIVCKMEYIIVIEEDIIQKGGKINGNDEKKASN